jgi:cytochrome b561
MMWRNTRNSYGLVSITLHWLVAITVIGLFVLGLWMVTLGYYDPWYQRAPNIHKSIGILLFATMLARLVWRYSNPSPEISGSAMEKKAASWAHRLMYALMYLLMLSGYLISTADGRSIDVFGWFSVPATLSGIENQEDIAGKIHELLAFTLLTLAFVHALAALKHHFVDRDQTLKRMLSTKYSFNDTSR